jgi:hypothetical protein
VTPSQYIRAQTEKIEKLIGAAGGILSISLARNKIGLAAMRNIATALKAASTEADMLVRYMELIKEN